MEIRGVVAWFFKQEREETVEKRFRPPVTLQLKCYVFRAFSAFYYFLGRCHNRKLCFKDRPKLGPGHQTKKA